jgi:hypothetical protein
MSTSYQVHVSWFRPFMKNGPLLRTHLAVAPHSLTVAVIGMALLLAYCSYTDLWRGMKIRNYVVVPLFVAGAMSVPVLFRNAEHQYIAAVVVISILVILRLAHAISLGDVKLLAGLAFFFGYGTIVLLCVSFVILLAYGTPVAIRAYFSHNRENLKTKQQYKKTAVPAGPSIAAAFPITLGLMGVRWTDVGVLIVVEVMAALLFKLFGDAYLEAEQDSPSAPELSAA